MHAIASSQLPACLLHVLCQPNPHPCRPGLLLSLLSPALPACKQDLCAEPRACCGLPEHPGAALRFRWLRGVSRGSKHGWVRRKAPPDHALMLVGAQLLRQERKLTRACFARPVPPALPPAQLGPAVPVQGPRGVRAPLPRAVHAQHAHSAQRGPAPRLWRPRLHHLQRRWAECKSVSCGQEKNVSCRGVGWVGGRVGMLDSTTYNAQAGTEGQTCRQPNQTERPTTRVAGMPPCLAARQGSLAHARPTQPPGTHHPSPGRCPCLSPLHQAPSLPTATPLT